MEGRRFEEVSTGAEVGVVSGEVRGVGADRAERRVRVTDLTARA